MTVVFVAGGAGGVGEGIVRAWLGEGARVVTASRDASRGERLRAETTALPGELVVLEGSASSPMILERASSEHGPFDHVVASVGGGGWRLAPLAEIDAAMFERVLDDGVRAHWQIARALLPSTRGSYVFINGGAALEVVPGTGPLSLVARAQLALAEIFAAEATSGPRLTSLVLATPIATRARGERTRPEWLDPDDVGRACVRFALGSSRVSPIVLRGKSDVSSIEVVPIA